MHFSPTTAHHSYRPRWRRPAGAILFGLALVMVLAAIQVNGAASDTISATALHTQLATDSAPVVLDVRSPEEYAVGHIPGARNIPYRELPEQLAALSAFQGQAIVVYCEVGVRAQIAEKLLNQAGFEQVLFLEGHMQSWRAAELPISTLDLESTP